MYKYYVGIINLRLIPTWIVIKYLKDIFVYMLYNTQISSDEYYDSKQIIY